MVDEAENRDFFEDSLRIFIFSLEVLSHDAGTQCEEMGNYNTAWEIQHDVAKGGVSLLRSSASYLTWEQTTKIVELAEALEKLPEDAISPAHLPVTSHAGCMASMEHPAWEPLRKEAKHLLAILAPAIRRNEAYFKED
jgi:hypothetical protein